MTNEQHPHADLLPYARRRYDAAASMEGDLPGGDLISPTWMILLYLFICKISDNTSTVTSACDASTAPDTSALRYISILVDKGYICRTEDPKDGRRIFLTISDDVSEKIAQILRFEVAIVLQASGKITPSSRDRYRRAANVKLVDAISGQVDRLQSEVTQLRRQLREL